MSKRTIGILLIVIGVILSMVSLFADVIGIGTYPGTHWAQILGTLIGVILSISGVWLALSNPKQQK